MQNKMIELLKGCQPGHTLARELYTDQDVYQTDLDGIFYRQWLFAIPACELEQSGSYVTHKVGDYRVILIRGADNKIRAFHNVCRHRGSMICTEAKGQVRNLVCPYHQWTYDTSGMLLWAKDMGSDFDASQHGLKPVHCREVSGLIYICLAKTPPNIDEFSSIASSYLQLHDLHNAKVAFESRIIEKGNWKLVWENNRECYHCSGNHPALCRTYPEDPSITGVDIDNLQQTVQDHFAKCESLGIKSNFFIDKNGQFRFARMPLLRDSKSYTMDGQVAVTKPLGNVTYDRAGPLLIFNYPSTWNHCLPDHCIVFRVTPISPTETEVNTKWLVHKDAQEGVHYDLNNLTDVWMQTNDEDRRVVEHNQLGVNSPAYQPGPYSAVHESGAQQFVDWYRSFLLEHLVPRELIREL